jgi:hypothetical protein
MYEEFYIASLIMESWRSPNAGESGVLMSKHRRRVSQLQDREKVN